MIKSKKMQFCAMTQNKLLQTVRRAVCTALLCTLTLIHASADSVSFGTNSSSSYEISGSTATVTLGASGDWAALISESGSSLPDAFSEVTKVVFEGSGVAFDESDASSAGVLINGNITLVDMRGLASVVITSGWSGYFNNVDGSYPSVLLPNGIKDDGLYNSSITNSIAHNSAFYSFIDDNKKGVYANGTDFSGLKLLREESSDLNSLYICGFGGYSSYSTYLATADIEGIENIVLVEPIDNWILYSIGESSLPTEFTHIKCFILSQAWYENDSRSIAWEDNHGLVFAGKLNNKNVLQVQFLQTDGAAVGVSLPDDEMFSSAAYFGSISKADLRYFKNAKHESLSLFDITYSPDGDDDNFVAATENWDLYEGLKYLVLPDLQTEATDPYLENFIVNGQTRTISETDADGNVITTTPNPNLKAVAYYDRGTDEGASSARNKFYEAQTEPGSLEKIMDLFTIDLSPSSGNTNEADHLSLSGYFNATDLAYCKEVDENGHLVLEEPVTSTIDPTYTYYNSTSSTDQWEQPFTGVSSLDLSKALLSIKTSDEDEKLAAQNDVAINQLGFVGLASVEFPRDENFYYIPAGCLIQSAAGSTIDTKMSFLCLPENIKRIGAGAFANSSTNFRIIYAEVAAAGGESIYDGITLKDGDTVYMVDGLPFTKEELAGIKENVLDDANVKAVSRTSNNGAFTVFDGITYATTNIQGLIDKGYLEKAEVSVTLPPNLEHIEKGAFWGIMPYDVFVLNGDKVATCEPWAFSAVSLNGNNGYTSNEPISKNNYSGNGNRMALLHYPTGLKTEEIELYKDITRVYSHADGLLATDDEGNVLLWPTQSEWVKSFGQASTGYLWGNWGADIATISSQDLTTLKATVLSSSQSAVVSPTFYLVAADGAATVSEDEATPKTYTTTVNSFAPYDAAETENGYLEQEETYIGWHQFVLAYGYNPVEATPQQTFYISDNNWWTICSPFSMTKEFIKKYFGDDTRVCTLQDVQRFEVDGTYTHTVGASKPVIAEMTAGSIVLGFGEDLVAAAETDDATVIEAQKPYMIKPSKKFDTSDTSITLELTSSQAAERDQAESTYGADKFTTLIHSKKTTDGEENATKVVSDDLIYVFIGSLGAAYYIPLNSYFLGWDSENSKVAYYYQKESPSVKNWNTYTCVVMPVGDGVDDEGNVKYSPGSEIAWFHSGDKNAESAHWIVGSGGATNEEGTFIYGTDDSLGSVSGEDSGSSKTAQLFFDVAGDLTAIDHVTAEGSFVEAVSGAVYSLSGIKVAESFNANALPKGIYIVGGKKVAVK